MAATGTQGRKRLLREEDMTKVEFETSEEVDVTPTFDTMGLREDLLRGIYAYGKAGNRLRPELTRKVGTHCDRLDSQKIRIVADWCLGYILCHCSD